MAEEKARHYVSKHSNGDAKAYERNFGAHRPGISMTEMSNYYTKWAKSGRYEQDLCPEIYRGPHLAAESLAEFYQDETKNIKILDVAAGTGLLGQELWQRGFRHIDGLDPAQGMLDVAKEKCIYERLICDYMTDQQLDVDQDTYDVIAIAGGMGEGHIPCGALREMIRIVKPGGRIVIVMREEYLKHVAEYKDRLEPLMQKLEDTGKWKRASRTIVPRYSFDNDGVIFIYEVC